MRSWRILPLIKAIVADLALLAIISDKNELQVFCSKEDDWLCGLLLKNLWVATTIFNGRVCDVIDKVEFGEL